MSDSIIFFKVNTSLLYNLYWYIKRKITNTGPHGKYCGCKKWGTYIGLGCSMPVGRPLTVHGSITNNKNNYE